MNGWLSVLDRLLWLLPAVLVSAGTVAESLVDPTRPPVPLSDKDAAPETRPAGDWRLSMTRVAGEDRLAILNGALVRVGQQVTDARVLAIAPDHVLLEQAGGTLRVELNRPVTVNRWTKTERQ